MIFHENCLLADKFMKYYTLFFIRKLGKMSQNVSSAAVVIGSLRDNIVPAPQLHTSVQKGVLLLQLHIGGMNFVFFCTFTFEPQHEISNNVVYAPSKVSDQPAHMRSLIRAFACRMNVL